MVAVYRLGFLYANGLGVRRDTQKAREFFSWRDDERNRTYLTLLEHNMLPKDVTEALTATARSLELADQRKEAEQEAKRERIEQERAAHAAPVVPHNNSATAQCRQNCLNQQTNCERSNYLDNVLSSDCGKDCSSAARSCNSRCQY